ncbi:hypothetical protein JCM5296_005642 [Sporobolomyces johnsonii]
MLTQLKSLIPEDEGPPLLPTMSKLRCPPKPDSDTPAPNLSAFIAMLHKKGDMITVAEHKAGLKVMGEWVSGNKAELTERAVAYLNAHGLWEMEEDKSEHSHKHKKKKRKR